VAIVVDEHGSVAGLSPLKIWSKKSSEKSERMTACRSGCGREPDGSLVLRGSVSIEKVQELFGVEWDVTGEESATTIAGLLNHIAGHVPAPGEHLDYAACALKSWKRINGKFFVCAPDAFPLQFSGLSLKSKISNFQISDIEPFSQIMQNLWGRNTS